MTSLLACLGNKTEESPFIILQHCNRIPYSQQSYSRQKLYEPNPPSPLGGCRTSSKNQLLSLRRASLEELNYDLASLEELAEHADRFIACLEKGHNSQPTLYPGKELCSNQSLINEVLDSCLDSMQRSVSKLSESKDRFTAKSSNVTQVSSPHSQYHHNKTF